MAKVTGQVYVDYSEYLGLLKDQEKLRALEAGGVDNWEGYDESMEEYREHHEDDEDE
jgi:hypothetical protein